MNSKEMIAINAEFAAAFPKLSTELGADNLTLLLDGASVQELAEGRTLIRDRMPVDFIYFILSGSLSVFIEQAGVSMKIAITKAGEWLGEISVLSGEYAASATLMTDTPCKFVRVHHISFEKLIAGNDRIAQVLLDNFIGLMAQRFRTPVKLA